MGNRTKMTVLYRGSLPERLSDILGNADETDLKILLTLMMSADEDGVVNDDVKLESLLDLDPSAVQASLKFWRGAGMLGVRKIEGKKHTRQEDKDEEKTEEKTEEKKEEKKEHAHRGGALEHHGIVQYETAALADLLEKRTALAEFVTEAQRVLGKTINFYDTSILVGLVDQLGFEPEAVLTVLAYAVRLGKATVRYGEKIALSFYDEGLTGADQVYERIERIESAAKVVSQIRSLLGLGSRSLSSTEKKLFASWTETMGYDIDVIRMAYDITIDNIHEAKPKYINGILEKWYADGLRTANDIAEFETQKKAGKQKTNDAEKSYNIDEFFEASLRRSYAQMDIKEDSD